MNYRLVPRINQKPAISEVIFADADVVKVQYDILLQGMPTTSIV